MWSLSVAPAVVADGFAVARLLAKYGDASMLGLLAELTGCPKWQSVGVYDRCKAVYER
jgi:hypothetical protein